MSTRTLFTNQPTVRRLAVRSLPLVYAGRGAWCPCCDGTFRAFVPRHGVDAMCPGCLSMRRHRLLLLYLLERTTVSGQRLDVLHLAPEEGLARKLASICGPRYVSVDADPSSIATVTADITRLPFERDTFDLALCSHVLEHVVDDHAAIGELFRVLRPGGRALVLNPVHDELPATYEDSTITEPEDRLRAFGQSDHVRIYGPDFVSRLEATGFEVETLDYVRHLPPETVARSRLGTELIYVATRPS